MTVDVEGFPSPFCFLFQRNKKSGLSVWVNAALLITIYKKGKSIETRLDSLIRLSMHFVLRLLLHPCAPQVRPLVGKKYLKRVLQLELSSTNARHLLQRL